MNFFVDKKIITKLRVAKRALFESHIKEYNSKCLAGTRINSQCHIKQWAKDMNGKSIFWLNGIANIKKSIIAQIIARLFANKDHFDASFFFKERQRQLWYCK